MPANKLRLCVLTCSLVASLCPLFGYYHIEFSHKLVSIFPSGTETTGRIHFLKTFPFAATDEVAVPCPGLLVQILQQDLGSFVVADAADL